jgi:G3E family GTPase
MAPAMQRGALLLEALIAIVVFSVGVLGCIALQAHAIRHVQGAQYRSEATHLVEALIGRMWAEDPAALAARVSAVAEAEGVLRIKGFASIPGKPMRLLVQAVGPRVAHHYDRPWAPSEAREGHLVVIGLKGINRDAITRALLG